MEDKPIQWRKIYLGLMASLILMIAFFYWLTQAYA